MTVCRAFRMAMIAAFVCGTAARAAAGPLHDAAGKGDVETMMKVVAAGTRVDDRDPAGVTPLMEASWRGQSAAVQFLISKNADVNAKSAKGGTALMEASIKGYPAVVKLLLDAGADINASNAKGVTALMWASSKGYPRVVRILIEKKADVRVSSMSHADPDTLERVPGKTALTYALEKGHGEIAGMLLDAGAPVDIDCNSVKCAPGDDARIRAPILHAASAGRADIVMMLVKRGARVNVDCKKECVSSETPLMAAALARSAATVQMLLSLGAAVDADGEVDAIMSGGMYAAQSSGTALMHLLFHAGVKDRYNRGEISNDATPHVVKMLLDAGARINFTMTCSGLEVSPYAYSSLCLGVMTGRMEIVGMLLEKGAGVNPPIKRMGEPPSDAEVDVSPLGIASEGGYEDIAAYLIDKGARVNAADNLYGTSNLDYSNVVDRLAPLHRAARAGHAGTVRLLLERKADATARTGGGDTALTLALSYAYEHDPDRLKIRKTRSEIVRLLLEKGADPNVKDRRGATALGLAMKYGYAEAAGFLRKAGARR